MHTSVVKSVFLAQQAAGSAIGQRRQLAGTSSVAGEAVVVDAATKLDAEHGTFAVGATLEVHAVKQDGGRFSPARSKSRAGKARFHRTLGSGATSSRCRRPASSAYG
jgi:hypothetical protein